MTNDALRAAMVGYFQALLPHPSFAHPIKHVVGVSGPSAIGKTTFCQALQKDLGQAGTTAQHVPLDGFLKSRAERGTQISGYDPAASRVDQIVASLHRLVERGEQVTIPIYSHSSGGVVSESMLVRPAEVVLLDGVTALHPAVRRRFVTTGVFFIATPMTLQDLRIAVEISERGYTPAAAHAQADREARAFARFVLPHAMQAQIRVEVASDRTKKLIMPGV